MLNVRAKGRTVALDILEIPIRLGEVLAPAVRGTATRAEEHLEIMPA